jgi:hypothetical protein
LTKPRSKWHAADQGWGTYWSNGPEQVANALSEAPTPIYGVRTLDDMSKAEVEALEAQYGPVVQRDRLPAFRS